MRIVLLGGSASDRDHVQRLAESMECYPGVVCAGPGGEPFPSNALSESGVLSLALSRVWREEADLCSSMVAGAQRVVAAIFEQSDGPAEAQRLMAALRTDPRFEHVPTLLALPSGQARSLLLPGGFDDFVLTPCGTGELLVRIQALLRRRPSVSPFAENVEGAVVDSLRRVICLNGTNVHLTAREFALFSCLCEWRGRVLSRQHLLARVWGARYRGGQRTVDIHIHRLRAKLGYPGFAIETVRGRGYRLIRADASLDELILRAS